MIFEKFCKLTKEFWDHYFKNVFMAQTTGKLDCDGGTILYPNILLLTKCEGYYIAELIGATKTYKSLSVKIHKEKSINRYLSQFDQPQANPAVEFSGYNHGIAHTSISSEVDLVAAKNRFPHLETYSGINKIGGGMGSLLSFGKNFRACGIHDCVFVNKGPNSIRAKFSLCLHIFSSDVTTAEILSEYKFSTKEGAVVGVHVANSENEERKIVASQLQTIYLFQGLRETTIGEFIKLHPEIIKKAFKTDHFLYEPSFDWIESRIPQAKKNINPDLLIKRDDGSYDIYDLKTALLNNPSLTNKKQNRRIVINAVHDGLAQLANYEHYFTYEANARHALEKYQIEVNKPKLVLVVGNIENYDADDIWEANMIHKDNIEIIDYDTLSHMFLGLS